MRVILHDYNRKNRRHMGAKLSPNLLLCRVVNVSAMQLWSYGLVSTCYTAVINLPAGKCVHRYVVNGEGRIDRASSRRRNRRYFLRNFSRGILKGFKTHNHLFLLMHIRIRN